MSLLPHVPGIILSAKDTALNNTDRCFWGLHNSGRKKISKIHSMFNGNKCFGEKKNGRSIAWWEGNEFMKLFEQK